MPEDPNDIRIISIPEESDEVYASLYDQIIYNVEDLLIVLNTSKKPYTFSSIDAKISRISEDGMILCKYKIVKRIEDETDMGLEHVRYLIFYK